MKPKQQPEKLPGDLTFDEALVAIRKHKAGATHPGLGRDWAMVLDDKGEPAFRRGTERELRKFALAHSDKTRNDWRLVGC